MRRNIHLHLRVIIGLFPILLLVSPCQVNGQVKRIYAGFTAGIGLPKIPVSQWRSPISFLGTLNVQYQISSRFLTQVSGGALTTVSLGSIDSRPGDLRFDLYWVSGDLGIRLHGGFRNQTYFLAGGGHFWLTQQFDLKQEIQTPGICLGLFHRTRSRGFSTIFEVRWMLLFDPDPNPQMATLTLGLQF